MEYFLIYTKDYPKISTLKYLKTKPDPKLLRPRLCPFLFRAFQETICLEASEILHSSYNFSCVTQNRLVIITQYRPFFCLFNRNITQITSSMKLNAATR